MADAILARPCAINNQNQQNQKLKLDGLFELYLIGKAPGTCRLYGRSYRFWKEFLERKSREPLEITALDVDEFVLELSRRNGIPSRYNPSDTKVSGKTIGVYITAMNGFYKYLIENDEARKNPFARIARVWNKKHFPDKRKPEMVPFDHVNTLLDAPHEKTVKGIRDRAILALLLGGGLRISEALSLKIRDVRSESGVMYAHLAHTKTGSSQKQALAEWAIPRIEKLLKNRRDYGAGDDSYLVVPYRDRGATQIDKPLCHRSARRLIGAYAKEIGLRYISPHSCRVTVCTKLIRSNVRMMDTSMFMRHSSLDVTAIYYRSVGNTDAPQDYLQY